MMTLMGVIAQRSNTAIMEEIMLMVSNGWVGIGG